MDCELITGWPGVRALRGEWEALLTHSRSDTVFLSWEWMEAWREAVGHRFQPFVVTVREPRGRLLGIAPFYRTTFRLARLIDYRALRVMGDLYSGAEYPDWIALEGHEEPVCRGIAAALRQHDRQWDLLWMPNVAGWTAAHDRITTACRAAGLWCRARPREFSAVALPADPSDYERALSRNKRSNLHKEQNRILSRPGVRIRRCGDAAELPRLLEALFELNHRRWSRRGQTGTFRRKPLEARFYRCFAPRALDRGWLRLYVLEEGGLPRAVQIGYAYRDSFHVLQEGFDPDYPRGAGNLLRRHVIAACIAEGLHTYDFLGEHTEHKRRWGARSRMGHDLLIGRHGLRNRLLFTRRTVWPTGRFLRPVLP